MTKVSITPKPNMRAYVALLFACGSVGLPRLRVGTVHKDYHWCHVYASLGSEQEETVKLVKELFRTDWEHLGELYSVHLQTYCNGSLPRLEVAPCGDSLPSLDLPAGIGCTNDSFACRKNNMPRQWVRACTKKRARTHPVFIHVPKTGGSSVESGLQWDSCHATIDQYLAAGASHEALFVASVRNPWSRLVAAHGFWAKELSFKEFVHMLNKFRLRIYDPWMKVRNDWYFQGMLNIDKLVFARPQVHWLLPKQRTMLHPTRVLLLRQETLDCDFEKLEVLLEKEL